MSKQRYPLTQARPIAQLVLEEFAPFCERIAIVGSIRREKATVGDAEILFVPKMVVKQGDIFGGSEMVDLADIHAGELLTRGWIQKRPSVTGSFTWGPLNKLAIHHATRLPIDLFTEPDVANWFRTLAIRTGPRELNLRLIEGAYYRGLRLHAYGPAFTRIVTGEVVPCGSEEEFFELCGCEYLPPKDRA